MVIKSLASVYRIDLQQGKFTNHKSEGQKAEKIVNLNIMFFQTIVKEAVKEVEFEVYK